MSCGCGGKLPASVTLRLEAARIAMAAGAWEKADDVYGFLTQGIDVTSLDKPAQKYDTPAARSDLLNTAVRLGLRIGMSHDEMHDWVHRT